MNNEERSKGARMNIHNQNQNLVSLQCLHGARLTHLISSLSLFSSWFCSRMCTDSLRRVSTASWPLSQTVKLLLFLCGQLERCSWTADGGFVLNQTKSATIIDFSVLCDHNIEEKHKENISKYFQCSQKNQIIMELELCSFSTHHKRHFRINIQRYG